MVDYPYINTTGKLQEFLHKISSMGVPHSANSAWLPTIGFGSNNHRPILKIMRFVGFLDGTRPTDRWIQFRDETRAPSVMAEGIRLGYSELYALYPDAHSRSDDELRNHFKGHMTAGEQVVSKTVSTFKVLCKFAEFGEVETASESAGGESRAPTSASSESHQVAMVDVEHRMPVRIDLRVQIDCGTNVEQINAIFAGLRTLLSKSMNEET